MREFDDNGLLLCKYQAEIFEQSPIKAECSSMIFLRRFFKSNFAKELDKGESVLFSLDVNEAFEDIEKEFGPSKYGKVKYSADVLFWVGYITRYISYTRNFSSSLVYKTFSPKLLLDSYPGFHTQGEEWVIANLLEMQGLTEQYFDPNYRLKEALRKYIHS